MKRRAAVVVERLPSGDVLGEIVSETGEILQSRSFGKMSEDGYRKLLKLVERQHPNLAATQPIELSRN